MEEENVNDKEEWSDVEDGITKIDDEIDPNEENQDLDDHIDHDEDLPQLKDEHNESMNDENNGDDDLTGLYDPVEFNGVNVPANIKELFHFVTKYRPQILEMETKLKPFLPDFIPAVGDPDPFLKIDRPDEAAELLGLSIIDEPSLNQSDPSVLDLRLRSIYKKSSAKSVVARTIDDANKSKAIDKWMKDINELHRSKPLPTVTYQKPYPDIDTLLQEWNPEVDEEMTENVSLLPPNLNCNLVDYIDIACGLLDIPVYSGHRVHSLHLLLTLFSEMSRLQKS